MGNTFNHTFNVLTYVKGRLFPRVEPPASPSEIKIDLSNLSPRSRKSVKHMKDAIENDNDPLQVATIEIDGIHSVMLSKTPQQNNSNEKRIEDMGSKAEWENIKSHVLRLVNFAILSDLIRRVPKILGIYIDPNYRFGNIDKRDGLPNETTGKEIQRGLFGVVYDLELDDIALKKSTKINCREVEAWLDQTETEGCPKLLAFVYNRNDNTTMCYTELLRGAITLEACFDQRKRKMNNQQGDIKGYIDTFYMFLAKNLTRVLRNIHKTGWIHGDLSKDNIMIQPIWSSDEQMMKSPLKLFIIDFDHASRLYDNEDPGAKDRAKTPDDNDVKNILQHIIQWKYDKFIKLSDAEKEIKQRKSEKNPSIEYKNIPTDILNLLIQCSTTEDGLEDAYIYFEKKLPTIEVADLLTCRNLIFEEINFTEISERTPSQVTDE